MVRGRTSTKATDTPPVKGRRSTQRARLLAGMIASANRDGYANANVSSVISQAGVSRPTFYEYFRDKDDCFLAAVGGVQERLLEQVRETVRTGNPELAAHSAVRALLRFAAAEPAQARFLTNEPMAGGPRALDARDAGIDAIEQIIRQRVQTQTAPTTTPDLPMGVIIGGIYRLLASRLRRGEPSLPGVLESLLSWLSSYRLPASEHRWNTLAPSKTPALSPHVPQTPRRLPPALPPGRPRISEEAVAENHRERIMFAAAQLAAQQGYNTTTIADITKLARVDGRVFYTMFADKQDAFMGVHELGFQQVMAVTAGAFFAGKTWPERNWEAGLAFTQFLERNPLIAHVGFVEAYAVGPGAVQRVEDSHLAFAMLLQEGYQHGSKAPPRHVLEAIITTIFEIVYRQTRAAAAGSAKAPHLSRLVPNLTFLALAPFSGPAQANEFIDGQQ